MRLRVAILAAAVLVAAIVVLGSPPAQGEDPAKEALKSPKPLKPIVTSKTRLYPKHYVKKRVKFRPWSQPSQSQVSKIIGVESRKWHVPAAWLHRRIACESGYRWWIVNGGGYAGLGQFAGSTFRRGMSTIRTRRVVMVRSRILRRATVIVSHLSDGTTQRQRGYKVKVRRTRISKGMIPRYPAVTHGWAQVRLMAQAMAGISAVHDSEWACGK